MDPVAFDYFSSQEYASLPIDISGNVPSMLLPFSLPPRPKRETRHSSHRMLVEITRPDDLELLVCMQREDSLTQKTQAFPRILEEAQKHFALDAGCDEYEALARAMTLDRREGRRIPQACELLILPDHRCGLCGHTCTRRPDLRLHVINLHSPVFPYVCRIPHCACTFSRRSDLVWHLWKYHEDLKPQIQKSPLTLLCFPPSRGALQIGGSGSSAKG